MAYSRRLVHYGPGPTDFKSVISDQAIAGCWFELHRQGGCGAAEIHLKDDFQNRQNILVGDWIAFEYEAGDRWYFGRVENRQSKSPSGVQIRLEGMSIQLGEVFPGGFGVSHGDGFAPHRYAATEIFSHDPDRNIETFDNVSQTDEMVKLLMQQYVVPNTDVSLNLARIEASSPPATVVSHKFRGEESIRSIMKDLTIRSRNSSWGVDESGEFFLLQKRSNTISTYQEGVDLIRLEETVDREKIFNRITLTGGYVYSDMQHVSSDLPPFYRWRGNYLEPTSRSSYGDRRIRIWVPWIRTIEDSREFAREFFRVYSQPFARFEVEVTGITELPRPWEGEVRILDRAGQELVSQQIETVRIQFDHSPRLFIELGPEDPRVQWPEPDYDERWEIPPAGGGGGGSVTLSLSSMSSSGGSDSSSEASSVSSNASSSDNSSNISSEISSSNATSSEFNSSSSGVSSSSGGGSSSSGGVSSSSGAGGTSSSGGGGTSSSSGSTILLKDTFTDTLSSIEDHLMDIGEGGPDTVGWSGTGSNFYIDTASDRATKTTGNFLLSYVYADSGESDVEVVCDVTVGSVTIGGGNAGIAARGTTGSIFSLVINPQTGQLILYESSTGGSLGTLRDFENGSLAYDTAYSTSLSCIGTAIEGSAGGQSVSYTDTTPGTGTECGLLCDYGLQINQTYFDNFFVYDRS